MTTWVNRFQVQREKLAAEGPQKWLDTLAPKVNRLRDELRQRDWNDLAQRGGGMFDGDKIRLVVWGKEFTIAPHDCIVRDVKGEEMRTDRQALVLMYLSTADGTPRAGKWLRYRELPGGMFYAHAFHNFAEEKLAQEFHGKPAEFANAAKRIAGVRVAFGNSEAFEFVAMPRIQLAAVLWSGDEDFPTSATVLFDQASSHYLPTDVVGALGSQLVMRLLGAPDDAGQTLTALAVQPPKIKDPKGL